MVCSSTASAYPYLPAGGFDQGKPNLGVAVDQATDDAYVANYYSGVEKFSSSGTDLGSFGPPGGFFGSHWLGVAVDPVNEDVYLYDGYNGGAGPAIDVFDSSGSQVSSFAVTGPTNAFVQIASDAAGNVYYPNKTDNTVQEFDSSGMLLNTFSGNATVGAFTSPQGVAVDSNGNVYVVDAGRVVRIAGSGGQTDPAGAESVLDSGGSQDVTVDPVTGDVLVLDLNATNCESLSSPCYHVIGYHSDGTQFTDFGAGTIDNNGAGSPPNHLAVDPTTGDVYVSDYQNQVRIFVPQPPSAPQIDGESAANLSGTTATLQAQVNPRGLDTTCTFQYGTDTTYSSGSAPCTPADLGSGFADQPASANVAGLETTTTYHYRVVATNSDGTTDGPDHTFTTTKGFGIASFDGSATNQDGSTDTQAGSHPYELTTTISFNTTTDSQGTTVPDGNVRDIEVGLPAGLIGDPSATPRCTDWAASIDACPVSSQVGTLTLQGVPASYTSSRTTTVGVYNLQPRAGEPALFGAHVSVANVLIDANVRTGGDYGVTATLSNITTDVPFITSSLTFWGVPADPSHDPYRGGCLNSDGTSNGDCPSGEPLTPFLRLPTSCAGPPTTTLRVDSWQDPGDFKTASFASHDNNGTPVGTTGCDKLDFTPSISVQPDTSVADSPSGLSVDLHVPQNDDPAALAEADLKTAVVALPAGVSVNPSAANGLAACSPAQIGLDNANEPSCPDASKIGSVEVDTPLLPDPLKGAVYFAQQTQNPFGSLLAIYVTAEADGVLVKLAGHVVPDPVTGQLTTTFDNNPQLPFTDFKLDFFGGPLGVLATPDALGTYTTTSSLSPWSGNPASTPSDNFQITSGAVSGFSPSFTAGTQNAQAGAFSPFTLSFSRSDTDQNLSGLSVTLPPGMLAKLAGVQECSEAALSSISDQPGTGTAQAADPSCPAGSQVGTVETGAGTGSDPFFLPGKAYLTGPYKGAPYGLAVVVPAVAGPLDLGTVVVRQALYIDPTTAQVTDVSDPFPTILDGIPLRIRRIDVNLNRPDFTVNPTSCDPMAITGSLASTGGLSEPVSSRFQVGGCAALAFSPKLKMSLTGKGKTKSGDHPALVSTLTQPFGQANIHTVKVTLPLSMALDPNNSQHVCNYDVALAVHGGAVGCPASTIVGSASAITPLLSQPLTGKVYLVQGIRFSHGNRIRTLPSLLVPLRGQIGLDLRANTSVNAGSALVTTFSTIPDAPVSKFTLTITGGKKGLLVITGRGRTICNAPQVTAAALGAQSGKTENSSIRMSTPCGKVHKAKKHKKSKKKHSTRHAVRSVVADRRPVLSRP